MQTIFRSVYRLFLSVASLFSHTQTVTTINHFHTAISRISKTTTSNDHFSHPILSQEDMKNGCKLGIDSYADTSVAGRHAHVVEFIEGKQISAKAWDNNTTHNLKIANVAYAYDSLNGQVIILLVNQAIYGGNKMNDSLLQPIQCLYNDVHIDTRPHAYYDDPSAQSIIFDDVKLPLEFNGPLPFLHVRRPTENEFNTCPHYALTSHDDWDPYQPTSAINKMKTKLFPAITHEEELTLMNDICSISSELLPTSYFSALDDYRELYSDPSNNTYRSISRVKSTSAQSLRPEELSRLWGVGLKTATRTLKATEHSCIKTIGQLTRRFRTDKAHMRYKRLST